MICGYFITYCVEAYKLKDGVANFNDKPVLTFYPEGGSKERAEKCSVQISNDNLDRLIVTVKQVVNAH